MSALTFAAQDSATMLWREIKHSIRLLRLLIVSAILVPVVMLLLFDYILGGTLGHGLGGAARGAPYIDYLVCRLLLEKKKFAWYGCSARLICDNGQLLMRQCTAVRDVIPSDALPGMASHVTPVW